MADQPIAKGPAEKPQMFSNLIASNPKKEGAAGSALVSTIMHGILIVLAVYMTQRVRTVVAEDEQTNLLIPVPEEDPDLRRARLLAAGAGAVWTAAWSSVSRIDPDLMTP